MKVLLVGGSGNVGSFITPYLQKHHELRVLDMRPPSREGVEYVEGSVIDPDAIQRALTGMDAFIWMVMQRPQGGSTNIQDIPTILANYDVNGKGLHLLLYIAQEMGITRGVYTSSMSVHNRLRDWYPAEEIVPLDLPSVYGLTKGYGELTCQYFARWFDMNLIGLRLTKPRAHQVWLDERRSPSPRPQGFNVYFTDELDVADAYLRALEAVQVGHGRFDAIFIAGDEEQKEHNLAKAKRVLGWEPRAHRSLAV